MFTLRPYMRFQQIERRKSRRLTSKSSFPTSGYHRYQQAGITIYEQSADHRSSSSLLQQLCYLLVMGYSCAML